MYLFFFNELIQLTAQRYIFFEHPQTNEIIAVETQLITSLQCYGKRPIILSIDYRLNLVIPFTDNHQPPYPNHKKSI